MAITISGPASRGVRSKRPLALAPIAALALFAWNLITSMLGWWIVTNPAPWQ